MENFEYSLGFNNVKGIPFDKYVKDFVFIVNNKPYETNRYVADLLSPIIRHYHCVDETIDSFIIQDSINQENESHISSPDNDYFVNFLKLVDFTPKNINEIQRKHYINYFMQLGNIDEYFRLQPEIKENDEKTDAIIDRLEFLIKNVETQNKISDTDISRIKDNFNFNKMITFLSNHFSEITKEQIKRLPIEIIEEIMNPETLKIDDEDILLGTIIDLYQKDDKYSILFEYVKFENVSEEMLSKFIDAFSISDINSGIWKSICKRLLQHVQAIKDKERYIIKYKEFKHDSSNEFHGIMRHLTDETNGNIHDNGTVEITANMISGSDHPKNLVDYQNTGNIYDSGKNGNAIINFDFKDKSIQLSSYSIKSYTGSNTSGHLKNWAVEVSNDQNSWKLVDEHENDSTLRTPGITATFSTKETDEFYRFIRIRQTGESWYGGSGNYNIYFHLIEFYGKLKYK